MLYVADALDAAPRVLVDPNGKRDDATIALSQWVTEPRRQAAGLRALRWRHRLEHLALPRRRRRRGSAGSSSSSASSTGVLGADSSGVYYVLLLALAGKSADGERGDDAGRPDVYLPQARRGAVRGRLVYQVTGQPTPQSLRAGHRGRAIAHHRAVRRLRNERAFSCRTCASPTRSRSRCSTAWDALYDFLGSKGDELYFQTTQRRAARPRDRGRCPRSRAAGLAHDRAAGRIDAITSASYIGGRVVVEYSRDARSVVRCSTANGKRLHEVALPGLGTATASRAAKRQPETFFSYSDYLTPHALYALRRRHGRT